MAGLWIGIAGAGLLGRLLAWRLAREGHRVDVFDAGEARAPQAAAFSAAGMLSPLAERDNAGPDISALGWRSIALWREWVARLPGRPFFSQRGSLLLSHRGDLGAAHRVLARLSGDQAAAEPQALSRSQLAELEPAVQGPSHAWLLPGEAQIDPIATLDALQADAGTTRWHGGRSVTEVVPRGLVFADGSERRFDAVFDVRGIGSRPALPVRGVRGETVWLHAPGHGLTRPLRLLHPRHRVYLVPRPGEIVFLGASEIESEDRSPVSLRSAVELMAAAHSVMPALAEARILKLDSNLRPALPDNAPRVEHRPGLVRINGLFRHGWLLAPALVEDALLACGLATRAEVLV